MKSVVEALIVIFQQGKKNDTIKTSMAISLVVFAVWFGVKFSFYKTQVEKIPAIEKTVIDHDKVIQLIPQMADDIRWLTRNRRGR